jgi:hypothetical protein
MKVYKIADVVNNEIVFCATRGWKLRDAMAILAKCKPVDQPRPGFDWRVVLTVDPGPREKLVEFKLPPLLSVNDSLDNPLFIANDRLVFYRDRLVMPERAPKSDAEREEVTLRTKKVVYDEQADLANLKAAVANLEATTEYTRSSPRRSPIPEDVKLLVWARDGGACAQCGSKEKLHFDHIIPRASAH